MLHFNYIPILRTKTALLRYYIDFILFRDRLKAIYICPNMSHNLTMSVSQETLIFYTLHTSRLLEERIKVLRNLLYIVVIHLGCDLEEILNIN